MEPVLFQLTNGIRVAHLPLQRQVCHFGLMINTGSRDELAHEHGLAHYIEHGLFKGTKKRKTFHILNRLDSVGGELNAFTSKEETWIQAAFLSENTERAIELVADIAFNATFPAHEIEKEKEVIADEIRGYKDNPSEMLFEEFDGLIWPHHAMGRSILGTEKSLASFTHNHIQAFLKRRKSPDNFILSFAGNIPLDKLKAWCEKHVGSVRLSNKTTKRKSVTSFKAKVVTETKEVHQVQWIAGCPSYSYYDDKRIGLSLLNNLLGGPPMNNRLSMLLREKHGLTYNVESNYQPFSDTGLFYVYLGVDAGNLNRCIELVGKELKELRTKKLSARQLSDVKKQVIGQIALSQDNGAAQMFAIGKSLQLYNRIDTLKEVFARINSVTASQLLEISNEMLNEKKWSSLVYTNK